MKKNKNGFTLVELLAIIGILAIILIIVVPKIDDITINSKNNAFFSAAKSILRKIDYKNMDVDLTNGTSLASFNLNGISSNDYDLDNSKIYELDDKLYINLVGKGKFENMNVCRVTASAKDYTIREDDCPLLNGTQLIVNLNGGSTTQLFNNEYEENEIVTLTSPERRNYTFAGWNVTGGTLENNVLTIGSEDTTIAATWIMQPTLIVNLNGGSTTQLFNNNYDGGTEIKLTKPTKKNYTFVGWTVSGEEAIVNNDLLIMGSGETILVAEWIIQPKLIVNLDGGTTVQKYKTHYEVGTKITLINPTKTHYVFVGWTVNGEELAGNILTIGNSDVNLVAHWERNSRAFNINLVGGSTTQQFENEYVIGTELELTPPTKTDYGFAGWMVNGEPLNGDTLIIEGSDIELMAIWVETRSFPTNINELDDYYVFIPPITGYYKLEVWGASGGDINTTYIGGRGGYSVGTIYLDASLPIYIYVGGQGIGGTSLVVKDGGYNGGGSYTNVNGTDHYAASGGGATHIATYDRGTLNNYEEYTSEILIVAGGGGGGYKHNSSGYCGYGGHGGGISGTTAVNCTNSGKQGQGGTQTSAGIYNAAFGLGGSPTGSHGSAGGGGYYGGGASNASTSANGNSGGGGGSGYIGGVTSSYGITATTIAGNEEMPNPDGGTMIGRTGDGYARITYLGP